MISNYEFIKTQAFEVSSALFRCTELFSQDKLRAEIEAAAVDMVADYETIHSTIGDEFPRIEKLIALIRLAESTGQIASINANVLYRELDNLTKAIRLEVVDRRERKNITASLEQMFTNSEYAKKLSSSGGHPEPVEGSAADSSAPQSTASLGMTNKSALDNSAKQKLSDTQFGNIESLLSAAVQSSQAMEALAAPVNPATVPVHETLNAFLRQDVPANPASAASSPVIPAEAGIQNSRQPISATTTTVVRQANPAIAPVQATSANPVQVGSASSPQVGSWQHVILQKVKELGQTTTKELTASFPEISERTIRFYLQKLVDNQAIDRIGSTGPGAAYRAKE
ncbi:MAG: hypothetical protein UT41_C0001G0111 [Candidatus Wolfebacteria bacterium GW2011_GWC2_39_22]|uniref:HTH hxlR-type domain-containing protein n=1 Tax=Candidatus Wolfebacteria bacterium GW2011_GWC2_39_22 TaxID=1619013 RepID=A0A0G0RFX0_9BACT|nr:MAG: hypothetical protein UT41_C0001G0111 [Candidatus Wolfebacteria bacterium GW2011_GWC2_39_22]HBI25768.1 hypothetical protein [Candidatus Wolfebacteria bacterium]